MVVIFPCWSVFMIMKHVFLSMSHFSDPDFIYWFIDMSLFVCMHVVYLAHKSEGVHVEVKEQLFCGLVPFLSLGSRDHTEVIITNTFTSWAIPLLLLCFYLSHNNSPNHLLICTQVVFSFWLLSVVLMWIYTCVQMSGYVFPLGKLLEYNCWIV